MQPVCTVACVLAVAATTCPRTCVWTCASDQHSLAPALSFQAAAAAAAAAEASTAASGVAAEEHAALQARCKELEKKFAVARKKIQVGGCVASTANIQGAWGGEHRRDAVSIVGGM